MSGILGMYHLDGAPVLPEQLRGMSSMLQRRGPQGASHWNEGPVGLGHTLLAATPESWLETLPLRHPATGCVITADIRLDNRDELLAALGLRDRATSLGDGGIALEAWLAWGPLCVERFLGDFALGIWDPRSHTLFCARDQMGMKPFYYHHVAGRLFAFGSTPKSILVLPEVPYRISETRIADYLCDFEGIDYTSSFFRDVNRLPPAHILTLTPAGLSIRRYWTLEPGPELRLPSDAAYAEAFLEVFTAAVKCRLRGAPRVGAMLSGGLDSSSVTAVAAGLLGRAGQGPLSTLSATSPDRIECRETRCIRAALGIEGLDPTLVNYDQIGDFLPELDRVMWDLQEPFDSVMTLGHVIYLAARDRGMTAVLDGAGSDVVLSEGAHIARMLQNGSWLAALHEARAFQRFWEGRVRATPLLLRSARAAFTPLGLRRLHDRYIRRHLIRLRTRRVVRRSVIDPELAREARLAERLEVQAGQGVRAGLRVPYGMERAVAITHPDLVAARERYDRVASVSPVEARDPFLDRRVVALSVTLPGSQKLRDGWPKAILRRATSELLPEEVRWRRGREHLGWAFSEALMERAGSSVRSELEGGWPLVAPFLNERVVRRLCDEYFNRREARRAEQVRLVAHLAAWLARNRERPGEAGTA